VEGTLRRNGAPLPGAVQPGGLLCPVMIRPVWDNSCPVNPKRNKSRECG
jgi:hypothetical protein